MRFLPTVFRVGVLTVLAALPALAHAETAFQSDNLSVLGADSKTPAECPNCLSSTTGSVALDWTCYPKPFEVDAYGNVLAYGLYCGSTSAPSVPSNAVVSSLFLSKISVGGSGSILSQLNVTHGLTWTLVGHDSGGRVFIHDNSWPLQIAGGPLASGTWSISGLGTWVADSSMSVEVTIEWMIPTAPTPACAFKEGPLIALDRGYPADERWSVGAIEGWGIHLWFIPSENGTVTVSQGTSLSNLRRVFSDLPTVVPSIGDVGADLYAQENATNYYQVDYHCSSGGSVSKTVSIMTPASPSAQGCFLDAPQRALPVLLSSDGSLDPYQCIAAAAQAGYSFAGRQNGSQCFAGNDLGHTRAYDGDCSTPCVGRANLSCGGSWRNKLFATGLRAAPRLPLPLPDPSALSLGCFQEGTTRALGVQLGTAGFTVESCIDTALMSGFSYAALENGGACYAGDELPVNPAAFSECSTPCVANTGEICGAASRSSVYATPAFAASASAGPGDSVHLEWLDQASDQTSFAVERKGGADAGFVQVGSLSPNVASYDDSGLLPLATYRYRIRASAATGAVSAHSIQVQAMSGSSIAIISAVLSGVR